MGGIRRITSFLSLDVLSWTMVWLVILAITICVIEETNTGNNFGYVWFLLLLFLIFCFRRNSLIIFYILFESRLIPVLVLIIVNGVQPERLSASYYFLIYTVFIRLPLLFLILKIKRLLFFCNSFSRRGLLLFMVLPFMVKLPVFGVHFWLPKAHVEARIRGSMVLAGLILKLGGFGLVRVLILLKTVFLMFFSLKIFYIFLAVLSRLATLIQRDSKKLVAYRRIAHITFILVAAFIGIKYMWTAVILSSISHCWASIGLFATAGLFSHFRGTRRVFIMQSKSFIGWLILVVFRLICINFSVPPLPSFFSEILLFIRTCSGRKDYWILILLGFIFCFYNIKFYSFIEHNRIKFYSINFIYCSEGLGILRIFLICIPRLILIKAF